MESFFYEVCRILCLGILDDGENRRREELSNEGKLQTAMEVLAVTGVNQSNPERKALLWKRLGVISYENSSIIRWLKLSNSHSYIISEEKKGGREKKAYMRNLLKWGFGKELKIQNTLLVLADNFWCCSREISQSVCCSCYSWMK